MSTPLSQKLLLWSESREIPEELRGLLVEASRIKDLDDRRIEDLQKCLELWQNKTTVARAARKYHALAEERGKFLAKLHPIVRLPGQVHGDWLYAATHAPAGLYVAELNPNGAASVRATNGNMLGIKPAEFEWLTPAELEALIKDRK